MKTIYGLFIGDKLVVKSEKRSQLIPMRDQYLSEGKDAYISIWIGRLDRNGKQKNIGENNEGDNK